MTISQQPAISNVAFYTAQIANMVFIEQPVGVGFSKANDGTQYGDQQSAEANFKFVLGFFERYPEYKTNDFYISSESYGGHYMPTLGKLLADRGRLEILDLIPRLAT